MKKWLLSSVSLAVTLSACQTQPTSAPVQQNSPAPASAQPGQAVSPSNTPTRVSAPGSSETDTPTRVSAGNLPGVAAQVQAGTATTPQLLQASNYNTETLIAGLRSGSGQTEAAAIAQRHGLQIQRFMPELNSVIFATQGKAVPELLIALRTEQSLEFVEADQVAVQPAQTETAVGGSFSLLSEDGEASDETEPDPEPTVEPSADPEASANPEEADPEESAEPEASAEPEPSPTATPEPTPTPVPEPTPYSQDTYSLDQYSFPLLKVPQAWNLFSPTLPNDADIAFDGAPYPNFKRAAVGIIDAGVELDHADLQIALNVKGGGQVVAARGFDAYSRQASHSAGDVSRLNYFKSSYKQGTHSAGIIAAAANNNKGIAGIAPQTLIVPIKAVPDITDAIKSLFKPAGDSQQTLVSVLADAIVWATNRDANGGAYGGVDILQINTPVKEPSPVLKRAIEYALSKNVVIVVPAGDKPVKDQNTVSNAPDPAYCVSPRTGEDLVLCDAAASAESRVYNYLATLDKVIAVGAVDKAGQQAAFSPSGPYIWVVAPGVDVVSSVPALLSNNSYAKRSGTAVAASHVSGVLALMVGRHKSIQPQIRNTPDVYRGFLSSYADTYTQPNHRDTRYGYGMVNAYRALGGQ